MEGQRDRINIGGKNTDNEMGDNMGEEQQLFEQSIEQVEQGDQGKKIDPKQAKKDKKKAEKEAKEAAKKKKQEEKKAAAAAKKAKKLSKSEKKEKTSAIETTPRENLGDQLDMKELNDSMKDVEQRRVTMDTNYQTLGRPTDVNETNQRRDISP